MEGDPEEASSLPLWFSISPILALPSSSLFPNKSSSESDSRIFFVDTSSNAPAPNIASECFFASQLWCPNDPAAEWFMAAKVATQRNTQRQCLEQEH
jgi:hypothetical protein